MNKDPAKRYEPFLLPALALITFAVFSPVLAHDFINYDDPEFVVSNPNIHAGVTLEGIRWAFITPHDANWIPLTWISHMLDVQLFGMDPSGHHFVNLLLHIASTLLLFVLFKRTTNTPWRSAAVALLFALHPLHVESVAWVAERKDVLSAFFWMLTLFAYVRYTEKPGVARYLAVLGCFILGLLSKPMVVTLPFVLLLLDWWPLGRMRKATTVGGAGQSLRRLIAEKVPLAVLSLGAGIITYMSQQSGISYANPLHEKVARSLTSYLAYLKKMIWPSDLAVIYPFSLEPPSAARIAAAASVLALVTGCAIVMRHRKPYLITGWLWYIITLLPVIGLVQIGHHSIADRYTYIPLIGLFTAVVWGVSDAPGFGESRGTVLKALAGGVLTAMIVLTFLQLRYWKNSETLFRHAIEVTEKNWIAHNNLGNVLLDEGKTDEAIYHFTEATKAAPYSALAYLNLGFAYQGKNEVTGAMNAFKQALQRDDSCHPAHLGLGRAYLSQGRRDLALVELKYLQMAGSIHAFELSEEISRVDAFAATNRKQVSLDAVIAP